MSEYLYGQESYQQEYGADGGGPEVTFFQYFHANSRRSVDAHFHYLDSA